MACFLTTEDRKALKRGNTYLIYSKKFVNPFGYIGYNKLFLLLYTVKSDS